MALTKADLTEKLYEELGFSKRECQGHRGAVLRGVAPALEAGESVRLSGFGKFDLREKKQRPGRNPKTGVEIPITARRVVTFRPGEKLRTRVEVHAGSK